jgi:hypothetical protein
MQHIRLAARAMCVLVPPNKMQDAAKLCIARHRAITTPTTQSRLTEAVAILAMSSVFRGLLGSPKEHSS